MQLRNIQEQFSDMILSGTGNEALDSLFDSKSIPLVERYAVYQNNVYLKLTDVLSDTFPTVKTLVGDDFMAHLCGQFIQAHPPQSGCLNHYGEADFASFIERFSAADSLPYLADIARLDGAANHAAFTAKQNTLTAPDLPALFADPEQARLTLNTDVHLIRSEHPILSLRDYCRDPDQQENQFDLAQAGETILVHQQDMRVTMLAIDEPTAFFLSLCQAGKTVPICLDETLKHHPSFNFELFMPTFLPMGIFKK